MKSFALITVLAMLCLPIVPALAADESEKATDVFAAEAADIEEFRLIHADSMTLTRKQDEPQVLEGSVDIILTDKEDHETRIKADKMTIYYKQDLRKVQKIEAEKSVEISRLGTVATTELAVYQSDKNIIELLKEPHVKDSRGELSADKITILIDSDKVVAEGNVKGTVYPEALEKATTK